MYWSQTESSKWSPNFLLTHAGHPFTGRVDIAAAISYTGKDIAATKIAISYQSAQVAHCGLRAPVPRPDAPTTRDRTAAPHPTTHGSQTGRVDITAAISCTGKEITATKTEISASTKVISSTVPRRQRAAKAVTSTAQPAQAQALKSIKHKEHKKLL